MSVKVRKWTVIMCFLLKGKRTDGLKDSDHPVICILKKVLHKNALFDPMQKVKYVQAFVALKRGTFKSHLCNVVSQNYSEIPVFLCFLPLL